ncbi:hypothetical protein JJB74_14890 [Noviherbaspirillum sp. DKR-6]|uniref:Uncharacterized protein n=1 Tax=Noviherbaspirillum pedocola TaxID=2801341 RepID=A0A934SUP1_9BURK|nr:hypothetical protein [Noviherbaspirillum pedocola]
MAGTDAAADAKAAKAAPAKRPAKAPSPKAAKAGAAPVKKAAKASPAKAADKAAAAQQADSKTRAVAKTEKGKAKKPRLTRDSFTMPDDEYAMLANIKHACLKAGFEVKKSQLLRIGIGMVHALDMASLRKRIDALTPLKPGRPKSSKA